MALNIFGLVQFIYNINNIMSTVETNNKISMVQANDLMSMVIK